MNLSVVLIETPQAVEAAQIFALLTKVVRLFQWLEEAVLVPGMHPENRHLVVAERAVVAGVTVALAQVPEVQFLYSEVSDFRTI